MKQFYNILDEDGKQVWGSWSTTTQASDVFETCITSSLEIIPHCLKETFRQLQFGTSIYSENPSAKQYGFHYVMNFHVLEKSAFKSSSSALHLPLWLLIFVLLVYSCMLNEMILHCSYFVAPMINILKLCCSRDSCRAFWPRLRAFRHLGVESLSFFSAAPEACEANAV